MAAVDRVLPWRRHGDHAVAPELISLLESYRAHHPKARIDTIKQAYEVASDVHRTQRRSSGESYINHPLSVAGIVASIGLDETSIVAALLHDAVEDTELTLDEITRDFGDEVAWIVDGVTKLERIRFDSREAQQAATMRKMLVAMARDLRVLLIKLADRLHNMHTLAGMPATKQRRIAQETLDIYAPLAHRLGIQEIKQQLEDLAFAALHPRRYAELDHLVATRSPERDLYIDRAVAEVSERLAKLDIDAVVTGRSKHLWSIYEKMVLKGREFDEIFDIVGVRVIVDTPVDCYAALGNIHGHWSPVVGRFKDYIAVPKFNLYQSLHTTVIGPMGRPIEVQIRTHEMHQRAEWGVAAHWAYKSNGEPADIDWLNRLMDWQSEVDDPDQFMRNLKTDLEQDEVFVFTPKGKVITLPLDSTPVDFAYAVHTEVGHACVGSRVNGRLVSLDYRLASGDTCEVITSKVESAGPSQDWLNFVASQRARNKIKQWFSRERRVDMIEAGRDDLNNEFRREGLPSQKVWSSSQFREVMADIGYSDLDTLLASIGEHHVSARSIAQKVGNAYRGEGAEEQLPSTVYTRRTDRRHAPSGGDIGVHVEGLDDVLVQLASCCTPIPGDSIIGFVTRGRGVSVHRVDCANAASLGVEQATRMIEVDWDRQRTDHLITARVEVIALDRSRLLRDVANALGDLGVNILSCDTTTGNDRVARMTFQLEMSNPAQFSSVLATIKRIESVYDVHRVLPGAGSRAITSDESPDEGSGASPDR
ncbi:MAG: GTP pyrophosphokinase [Ilumatobacter coccineus]|uniref:GTP pyrophosphokinase n=1 Tax=Ilumatobacter coccineus TaxID=467094 RepID=A0A2G6KAI4_9ACTN|nr:MAG: GTP pyrophosphokinase [Ilumatobacter coccineus]